MIKIKYLKIYKTNIWNNKKLNDDELLSSKNKFSR